jgi:hypothetical protein
MTQQEMELNNYHQIDERDNAGIHVALYYKVEEFYSEKIETFQMLFEDMGEGFSASFEVPKDCVLDAWNHPAVYAHAAIQGKALGAVTVAA